MRRKRGIECNALGRSRGGFSTKLHALVDARGKPLYVALTPGQRHEMSVAAELLEHAVGRAFMADTGYDADWLVEKIRAKGMKAVICNHPSRKHSRRRIDRRLYRQRYLVELFFHRLKRFRGIATRFEKTARSYLSLVHVGCCWLWLEAASKIA